MIPEAYIEDDIDERDWWFGAGKTLVDVVRDNGDWRLYLPKFETQRKNVVTEEDKENEKEEFSKIMKKHVDQREEDVKKVFDTMRDNLQSWWD